MSTTSDTRADTRTGQSRFVPQYGPVDAALGYGMFYILFDRATPAFKQVIPDAVGGISPSLVGTGLAMFMWFVLAVTVIEQLLDSSLDSMRTDPAPPGCLHA